MGTSSLAVKETLMPWAAHCDAVFQAEWCINITLENFVQQPSFCCLDRGNENKVADLLCCHILYKPISKNNSSFKGKSANSLIPRRGNINYITIHYPP